MEIKLVINNPKTGRSYQKQLEGEFLVGMKIGAKVNGDNIGLPGYELEITGGSDNAGFPMRRDIDSSGRKQALLTKGPGVHINREGMKKRKTVRGNTIGEVTAQVNLKITKLGSKDLEELLGIKKEEPAVESEEHKEKK
ncbi:MAG: 30S ribosomal protein S6e [archaeon]